MKLMTKEIIKKAQKQFPRGSDMAQMVVAKFFDPLGSWTWYLMNQDPSDPDYLWGIVNGTRINYYRHSPITPSKTESKEIDCKIAGWLTLVWLCLVKWCVLHSY